MTQRPHHHRVLGTSPEWLWLIKRGPHGPAFSWHVGDAPHYNALTHLKEIIHQQETISPGWSQRVRHCAMTALGFEEEEIIRRAIQVLCVVGANDDFQAVLKFVEHSSLSVRKDALACLFEHGIRVKGKRRNHA